MLESSNLKYRPITIDDTDMVLKWRNSDYVRNRFLYRSIITRDEHISWFNEKIKTGEVIQFIIIEKASDKPVGSVYFRDIDRVGKSAEYGIFIGESSARGRGYGSETAERMVGYFFNELKLDKLILRVIEGNEAAVKSYEHAGFKRDKDRIEKVDIGGKEETVIFMSVTKDDIKAGSMINE